MKKRKKEMLNKILAIFISIITISMSVTLAVSMNAPVVKADNQVGCCEVTANNMACQEISQTGCKSGFHSGQACSRISQCKPGTCVPTEGRCMAQKTKGECNLIPDTWWTLDPIDAIPACQEGCCGIAKGIFAQVTQKKECTEKALELGYTKEDVEFDDSITRQDECYRKYATADRGCCVLGGGECKYGIREECTSLDGNFIPLPGGKYCNVVTQCAVKSHAYCGCGSLPGNEFNIYWYDSQGNQEDMVDPKDEKDCNSIDITEQKHAPNGLVSTSKREGDCNYPNAMCFKEKTEQVYCKDTTCNVNGMAQEVVVANQIKENPDSIPRVASGNNPAIVESVTIDKTLLTGQSTCYNFFSDFVEGVKPIDFSNLPSGNELNILLKQGASGRSTGLQNEIIHCTLGDIEIEGLGTDREKLCFDLPGPQGAYHTLVKDNNWENCTQCGSGGILFVGGAIGDLLGPFPPLGRMISGTLGHYCDPDSCTSYGDCVYHEDLGGVFGLSTRIGSCDPIYSPGTSTACSQCGGGGDGFWNMCDRSECESLGNCQFTPAAGWQKALLFVAYGVITTYLQRVNLIPVEIVTCGIIEVTTGGLGCNTEIMLKDRMDRYVKGPIAPFFGMLTLSSLRDPSASTFQKILNVVTTAGTVYGAVKTFTK